MAYYTLLEYLCTVKNLSPRSIILGIGIAVIVPLICFFILRGAGHDGHVQVPPHYGVDTVVNGDTVYHTIQDNQFVTHLKDTVNLATAYPGKVLLINFFSTTGGNPSERLTYHFRRIQKGFKLKKTDTAIQLISISADKRDSLADIREYADKHSHDHDTWTFLKGLNNYYAGVFAQNELMLPEAHYLEKAIHLPQFALIDKYRNIRGYYNGMDSMEIKRCIDDIATLMVEKNKIHEKKRR